MQSAHRGPRVTVLRRALAVAGLSLAGVFAGATAAQALTDVTDPLAETVTTSVAEPGAVVVEVEVVEPTSQVVEPVAEVVEPVAEVVEPVAEVVEPVAEVVEPVAEVAAPVTGIVAPVTDTLDPVTEPVTDIVAPVTDVVAPITEVLDPVVELSPEDAAPDAPAPSAPTAGTGEHVNLPKRTLAAPAAAAGEDQLSAIAPAPAAQQPGIALCEVEAPTGPGLIFSSASPTTGSDLTVETPSVSEPASPTSPHVGLSPATSSASAGGAGSRSAVDAWCQSTPWTPSLTLTGLVSGAQLCPPRPPYQDIPTSPA